MFCNEKFWSCQFVNGKTARLITWETCSGCDKFQATCHCVTFHSLPIWGRCFQARIFQLNISAWNTKKIDFSTCSAMQLLSTRMLAGTKRATTYSTMFNGATEFLAKYSCVNATNPTPTDLACGPASIKADWRPGPPPSPLPPPPTPPPPTFPPTTWNDLEPWWLE